MAKMEPYLNFDGNAKEALAFYEKALNGKVTFSQTFGDSPMGNETPAEMKDKLMHAVFVAGEIGFMVSDMPPGMPAKQGNNITLSLQFEDNDEVERVYKALSEGARVHMPMQETFWAEKFAMITDKFGINWMFNKQKAQ